MIGIYKIMSPSNKIYIGQSINIYKRFKTYKVYNCKGQIKLYNSLKKYGWNNHTFEIVEECIFEELNNKERYWQDFFNCMKNGLNCVLTSTKLKKGIISNETKEKQSLIAKNRSLKIKEKIANSRKYSIETKEKISKAHKNKIISKETKQKMSESHKKRNYKFLDKKIYQYDLNNNFIQEWESIKQAQLALKISNISSCANNKRKTSSGFIWKFY